MYKNTEYEESLRKRVIELMHAKVLSQRALAVATKFQPSNLSQILRGNRDVPESLINEILLAYPDVDSMWLVHGVGNMYSADNKSDNVVVENENTKPRLPITAAAGNLADYLGGVLAHECEQIPVIRSFPDYDFTIMVKGNSMEPKYEGGDEIACKKVESIIEWGKSYVLATRDGAVLKRLYKDEDGVRCVSYNHEEYPDFIVRGDDILGVYRVVGLVRTGS